VYHYTIDFYINKIGKQATREVEIMIKIENVDGLAKKYVLVNL
jgi:hypothetical protein